MTKSMKDLFIEELKDTVSSENQIVKALPNMVKASENPNLKAAFETHLKETKEQLKRLEKIFKIMKITEKEKTCHATKGLIQECVEAIQEFPKSPLRDAAIISKAQRIEHYEISAYGTLRTFAKELDLNEVAHLLNQTLDEESHADRLLTKIAEGGLFKSGVNHAAHLISEKPSNLKKPTPIKKAAPKKAAPKKRTAHLTPKKAIGAIKKSVVKVGKAVSVKAKSAKKAIHKKFAKPAPKKAAARM